MHTSSRQASTTLPEGHFTGVIRGLLDGIDQTMQLDCGRKARLAAFTVAARSVSNSLREQCVHLTDIDGFA